MPLSRCEFRFYEELNDFLPPVLRQQTFEHDFDGTPSVKDRIEALGVPHTEVDLILVDGVSVGFTHLLRGGERVAVYPMFERFDLTDVTVLRPRPLRQPRFVLDVHLGRLAGYLRLLGFDTRYRNDFADIDLVNISLAEHRIVLTRDTGLLKRSALTHGAFVHETNPRHQLREMLDRFDLESQIAPFTRCARCNGLLEPVPREVGLDAAPPSVAQYAHDFTRCRDCDQLYWPGSHLPRLRQWLAAEIGVQFALDVQEARGSS
ncbi:twitching motility protein PilT [Rhodococcus sp. WMMA185]|uniref:Mut7-C RNAse domain-containing protein n=1 Tax=Rhodococcus sp. WMMA185 TaxID=679318 RepID=UPI000878C5DA|nr:Mut7-C RNAse domain-containing protein [Rhodococcus sp. WMMA185]AOW93939.1 twitching motility protein PilT [Rhodococcus sp. WMMA185]